MKLYLEDGVWLQLIPANLPVAGLDVNVWIGNKWLDSSPRIAIGRYAVMLERQGRL